MVSTTSSADLEQKQRLADVEKTAEHSDAKNLRNLRKFVDKNAFAGIIGTHEF